MREIETAFQKYNEEKLETPFVHIMKIAKYNKYKSEITLRFKGHKVEYNFPRNEAKISLL
jgi:hypothetical protein